MSNVVYVYIIYIIYIIYTHTRTEYGANYVYISLYIGIPGHDRWSSYVYIIHILYCRNSVRLSRRKRSSLLYMVYIICIWINIYSAAHILLLCTMVTTRSVSRWTPSPLPSSRPVNKWFFNFTCVKNRCVSRESHSLTTGGNLIILSSGRLYYNKYHYDLIRAMDIGSTDELWYIVIVISYNTRACYTIHIVYMMRFVFHENTCSFHKCSFNILSISVIILSSMDDTSILYYLR
jgi:hypothetical protein